MADAQRPGGGVGRSRGADAWAGGLRTYSRRGAARNGTAEGAASGLVTAGVTEFRQGGGSVSVLSAGIRRGGGRPEDGARALVNINLAVEFSQFFHPVGRDQHAGHLISADELEDLSGHFDLAAILGEGRCDFDGGRQLIHLVSFRQRDFKNVSLLS